MDNCQPIKSKTDFLDHEEVMYMINKAVIGDCWAWNADSTRDFKEKFGLIYLALHKLTSAMIQYGANGHFWICSNPDIISLIELSATNLINHSSKHSELGNGKIHQVGVLNQRWRVYIDYDLRENVLLIGCGYKKLERDTEIIPNRIAKLIIHNPNSTWTPPSFEE